MADLGAVLRKTIDGLPNATPDLRAKVYDKARSAILRQIDGANPPLPEDVAESRRAALEDAIQRTENHYLALDEAGDAEWPGDDDRDERQPPAAQSRPDASRREPVVSSAVAPPVSSAARTSAEKRSSPTEAPRMPRADTGFSGAPQLGSADRSARETGRGRPGADDAKTVRREPSIGPRTNGSDEEFDIPNADTSAPRYSAGRAQQRPKRRRAPLAAGVLGVLLLAGAGAAGYVYREPLGSLILNGGFVNTAANGNAPAASGNAAAGANGEGSGDEVAALPSATPPGVETSPSDDKAPPASQPASKRRFNQRLQADGTEIDAGPGPDNANAFDEGTNIAAATPEPPPESLAAQPGGSEPPPTTLPNAPPAQNPPASGSPTSTASLQPNSGVPAVAQKAMFYEERTDTEQGSQQVGNVVWSVVSEPPAEGQPPEPAIRGIADIPGDKIKLTMTIRRNLDPTLPASHVIELMFDVPEGFAGGQVANVQRLALKPSEEARGDPLIGVAGKISDGFFIIALNNLDKATQTNLDLLSKQEWIDIPLAYATGRRALMSVEKGIPGDRVFKEAIDAWAAKT